MNPAHALPHKLPLALLLVLGLPASQAAPRLPLEAFATLPAVQRISLSPDGLHAAMLVNSEGNTSIVVHDLAHKGAPANALMSTDNRKYSYQWLHWVGNHRLLVGTRFPSKRAMYSGAMGGVDTQETRLLTVDIGDAKVVNLMKPGSFTGPLQPQFQDQVIDFEPDDGKHVLLELSDQQRDNDPAVYSLDVETGTRSVVQTSRENFRSWMVDRQHRVRVGIRRDKTDVEVHACDPDGKNWRKLWSYKVLGGGAVTPVGFGKDPNQLYILASHDGHTALSTVDLRDPELKRTIVLANANYDIGGRLVYSRKSGEAIGLQGTRDAGRGATNYWDKDQRELIGFIDEALPKRFNYIVSMSDDGTRYVVESSNAETPGEFYLGDDRANTLNLFAQSYPGLAPKDMVAKQSVKIKARDGLMLPAFLSLPAGVPAKQLPTVLLVHGGPQGHDDAGFDSWSQFLANRGYAVLQVNFRGSTGNGDKLMAAGLRRWGLEMQDDLSDAAQWAVARGTADPKRICIVGASYGGYAALMGVAKTPDQYRCAVSFAGVTDLLELGIDEAGYRDGKELYAAQVGSIDDEKARLRATSPRYLAAQIKAPVLLIHGTHDRSVSYEQAELMDAALTAAGKPHRLIRQEDGDHHLSVYQHRLQFFSELDAFLAKNL